VAARPTAPGNTGAGQPVATVHACASPPILAAANESASRHGLPTMGSSQFSQIVPPGIFDRPQNPSQDPQGWYGEETLDVEAVHAMAPGGELLYVRAPDHTPGRGAPLH